MPFFLTTLFACVFLFNSIIFSAGSSLSIYHRTYLAWDDEAELLTKSQAISFYDAKELLREKYIQLFKSRLSQERDLNSIANYFFKNRDFVFLSPTLEYMKENNIKWGLSNPCRLSPCECQLPSTFTHDSDFKNAFIYYACRDSRNISLLKNFIEVIDHDGLKSYVQKMILIHGLRNHDLELIEQVVPNIPFSGNNKDLVEFFVSEDHNLKMGGLKAFLRLEPYYRSSDECVSSILSRSSKNLDVEAQEIVTCTRKVRKH